MGTWGFWEQGEQGCSCVPGRESEISRIQQWRSLMRELGCGMGSRVLWHQLQLHTSGKNPTAVGSLLLSKLAILALRVVERFFYDKSPILCSFP